MKLIDILVEELPKRGGWPDDSDGMCQSQFDCEIYTNSKIMPDFYANERAEDCHTDNIITRKQYEAALAAKNEGWVEWGGGRCPVDDVTEVDIKFRTGGIAYGVEAGKYYWPRTGKEYDIIAYRLHKQQKEEQTKADDESSLNECISHDAAPVWSGEGLPPVGCFCEVEDVHGMLVYGHVESGEVIAHVENTAVIRMSYGLGCFEAVFLRPIRTESERKRDEVRKAMYAAMNIIDGDIADAIYDAIAAGEIPGVKLEDL